MFLLVGILWLWDAVFSYYHVQISLTFGHHIDMMQQGMFSPRFPFPAAVLVKNICIAWHHRLLLLDFLDLDSSIECALGLRILRRWVTWQSHFVGLHFRELSLWYIILQSIFDWIWREIRSTLNCRWNLTFPQNAPMLQWRNHLLNIFHMNVYIGKKQNIRFLPVYIYPEPWLSFFLGGFNPPKEDPYIDQNNNDQHGWRSLKVGTSLASMGSSQWMRNRTTTTDLQATTCWDAWREVGWYVVCSCVKKRVRWRKWFDISKIVYKMLWVNLVGSFVDFDLSSMTLLSCGKWFKDIDANCRTCYFQALSLRLGMTWNWVAMWLEGRFRSLKLFKRFFLYNGHDFKAALSHDGSTFFAPFLATTKPASRWVPNDYSDAVSMKCLNYYVSTFTLITSYGWSNKSCTNWYV